MAKRPQRPTAAPTTPLPPTDPRQRLLTDLAVLKVAVTAEALDAVLRSVQAGVAMTS